MVLDENGSEGLNEPDLLKLLVRDQFLVQLKDPLLESDLDLEKLLDLLKLRLDAHEEVRLNLDSVLDILPLELHPTVLWKVGVEPGVLLLEKRLLAANLLDAVIKRDRDQERVLDILDVPVNLLEEPMPRLAENILLLAIVLDREKEPVLDHRREPEKRPDADMRLDELCRPDGDQDIVSDKSSE
jgi:hypothetical protein